jgi:hypothetical protein
MDTGHGPNLPNPMQPNLRLQERAFVLSWVAVALLGIYAVTVLAAALPVQVLQPAWIERVCGSLRGGVSFPLIALVLFVLADCNDDSPLESRQLTVIRRWACFVALGFLLMIPLQTWAGVQVLQQSNAKARAQLRPYNQSLASIRKANSEEALLRALAKIPGSPANLGGTLKEPVPQVRAQLILQLEPQVKARQNQLDALQGSLWQEGLLRWFKDGLVALFSAIGFAAIGRSAADRPTLLQVILDPRPSQRRRPDPELEALMPPDPD